MQEIIEAIKGQTGLSEEKAKEVINTVSHFVKERFPLLAGTVDSILGTVPQTSKAAELSDDYL